MHTVATRNKISPGLLLLRLDCPADGAHHAESILYGLIAYAARANKSDPVQQVLVHHPDPESDLTTVRVSKYSRRFASYGATGDRAGYSLIRHQRVIHRHLCCDRVSGCG